MFEVTIGNQGVTTVPMNNVRGAAIPAAPYLYDVYPFQFQRLTVSEPSGSA